MEELFLRRPFSNKEADVLPATEGQITHGKTQEAVGRGGGGDPNGDAIQSI